MRKADRAHEGKGALDLIQMSLPQPKKYALFRIDIALGADTKTSRKSPRSTIASSSITQIRRFGTRYLHCFRSPFLPTRCTRWVYIQVCLQAKPREILLFFETDLYQTMHG